MMSPPVEVVFKLAWQNYRVGDRITPPAMLRGWLMDRGFVDLAPALEPGLKGKAGSDERASERQGSPHHAAGRKRK